MPRSESSVQNLIVSEPSPRTKLLPLLALTGFWALIYLPGLAWPPMMDDPDSAHAVIAREMLQRHDYVTMYVNGVRYLDKAPLPYWITAVSFKFLGVNELSARLPLTLFALFTMFAVYALACEIAGEKVAFASSLVFGTCIGPYIYTRFTIPDIMVCFWLTVTVHLFWRTLQQASPSRLTCCAIGAISAANVLTKGLIGMVFPVAIIGAYLLLTGNLRRLWRMHLVQSVAVFLALAAPWHILATLRNPPAGESKGFFWFYFINEQVYRYLNMRVPRDYDKVPLLLFWGLVLVWVFPWSFFVVSSLKQVPLRIRRWRENPDRETQAILLLAVWALVILVFFSFSTRQEYYVLPALPALAILCGLWLNRESESPVGSSLRRSGIRFAIVLFVLGLLGSAIATFFAVTSKTPPPGTDITDLVRSAPDKYLLSMGHLFDLTSAAMGMFRWPLAIFAAGLFLGTLLNWIFRRSGSPDRGNLALAGMMVVVLYAVHLSLGIFNPVLGSKPLATAIQGVYQSGDTIVVNGDQWSASTVLFYTGIPLQALVPRTGSLWYGSLFPDSPNVFEDDASFARLWQGPRRVFFVSPSDKGIEKLQTLGKPFYTIASSGGKSVYTNYPPGGRL